MNVLNKIKNALFGLRFKPVDKNFISKDNLFSAVFEGDWEYSVDGNSYYFFSNDALKGSFEISMIWNRPVNKEFSHAKDYAIWLLDYDLEENNFIEGNISGQNAIYIPYDMEESNLDFHSWFLSVNKVLIHLKFTIYEEENQETKDLWLKQIAAILDNIVFNFDNFRTIKMK